MNVNESRFTVQSGANNLVGVLYTGKDYEVTTSRQVEEGRAIYEYAAKLPFVSKIILFGHSQGGLVAGLLASDLGADKVSALVQVVASAAVKDSALTGIVGNVKVFDPDNIPERIPLGKSCFAIGWEYFEEVKTMPIYEKAETYSGKVLLVHGERIKLYLRKVHAAMQKHIRLMQTARLFLFLEKLINLRMTVKVLPPESFHFYATV